jgi:hypothetical protein
MNVEKFLKKVIRTAWCCLPRGKRVSLARAVIHQANADEQRSIGVVSLEAGLSQLRASGFAPTSVIDVGANRGSTPRSQFFIALLGAESREEVRFYQMGTGSSVLAERSSTQRNELKLRMSTLDDLVAAEVNSPMLLKLDVQGYELEVLRGARKILAEAEVVVIECSLIQYNDGAPLFAEVVSFMSERGFLVYDPFSDRRDLRARKLHPAQGVQSMDSQELTMPRTIVTSTHNRERTSI